MKQLANPFTIAAGVIVIVIGTGTYFWGMARSAQFETVSVERTGIVQEVSASGEVKPATKVDLHFKSTGRLVGLSASVGKTVAGGQVLARQDTSELSAQLAELEAAIAVQEARLAQLLAGASAEEIKIAETAVTNARRALVDSLTDAYLKADDAVRGKSDQLFTNPRTQHPQLLVSVTDQSLKNDVEWRRLTLETTVLPKWALAVSELSASSDDLLATSAMLKEYGESVKVFLDQLALVVNDPTTRYTTGGETTDVPSTWKTDVATGRTNVGTALSAQTTAENTLTTAQDQLSAKKAPARASDIALYEAQIAQAKAALARTKTQISDMLLTAPAAGIVTSVDGEIGELIGSDKTVVSLMSGALEVDVDLSENNVAYVKLGQDTRITLDAFSDVSWKGRVTQIEPAGTEIGGNVYYKTTVVFEDPDERVKAGMTANVYIETAAKSNVLVVPTSALESRDGKTYLSVFENGQPVERAVELGIRSKGMVEIISGVSEGEAVVLSK
jgi:HlyD family secretion protein